MPPGTAWRQTGARCSARPRPLALSRRTGTLGDQAQVATRRASIAATATVTGCRSLHIQAPLPWARMARTAPCETVAAVAVLRRESPNRPRPYPRSARVMPAVPPLRSASVIALSVASAANRGRGLPHEAAPAPARIAPVQPAAGRSCARPQRRPPAQAGSGASATRSVVIPCLRSSALPAHDATRTGRQSRERGPARTDAVVPLETRPVLVSLARADPDASPIGTIQPYQASVIVLAGGFADAPRVDLLNDGGMAGARLRASHADGARGRSRPRADVAPCDC